METFLTLPRLIILLLLHQAEYATAQEQNCELGSRLEEELKVVCHVGLWFTAAHHGSYNGLILDPFLCTHYVVNYFGIYRSQNKWELAIPTPQAEKELMNRVFQLKTINPDLKMLIAIGGYGDNLGDVTKYFDLMSSESNTREFTQDTIQYLMSNHLLDGVDFQWNYPGRHPDSNGDVDRELLGVFTKQFCATLRAKGYICMITLQRPHNRVENRTKTLEAFKTIVKGADIVTIWTADIPPEPTAFVDILHTDLLYKPPLGTSMYDDIADNTVQALMEVFINEVLHPSDIATRSKLLLTIPMQANSFSMKKYSEDWTNSWPQEIINENSIPRPPQYGEKTNTGYTTGLEQIPFFKVCRQVRLLPLNHPMKQFLYSHYTQNGVQSAPIAYNRERLVPTNTIESVQDKAKYAKQLKLGGVSVFQIGADDVNGWCYNQTYPLLNAIYDEMRRP